MQDAEEVVCAGVGGFRGGSGGKFGRGEVEGLRDGLRRDGVGYGVGMLGLADWAMQP